MEYIIVQQASLEDQIEAVNLRLKDGWECVGDCVLCTYHLTNVVYHN